MADLPDGIHDLTDEDWARCELLASCGPALGATAAEVSNATDGTGLVTVAEARAYLDAAAALWAGLTGEQRRQLQSPAPPHFTSVSDKLADLALFRTDWFRYAHRDRHTPLGRAVARAEGVLREDGGA